MLVGAVQCLRATGRADGHLGGCSAHGTVSGNGQLSFCADHAYHLGNDLVGFDYFHLRAFVANAQSFALADIAQRGALDGGALQFDGFEHGDG